MDTITIEPKVQKRSLVEALKVVEEKHLLQDITLDMVFSRSAYICIALHSAEKAGDITAEERHVLHQAVLNAIYPSTMLASFLHNRKQLPEHLKGSTGGYNVMHPDYLRLRNQFLKTLADEIRLAEARVAGLKQGGLR